MKELDFLYRKPCNWEEETEEKSGRARKERQRWTSAPSQLHLLTPRAPCQINRTNSLSRTLHFLTPFVSRAEWTRTQLSRKKKRRGVASAEEGGFEKRADPAVRGAVAVRSPRLRSIALEECPVGACVKIGTKVKATRSKEQSPR